MGAFGMQGAVMGPLLVSLLVTCYSVFTQVLAQVHPAAAASTERAEFMSPSQEFAGPRFRSPSGTPFTPGDGGSTVGTGTTWVASGASAMPAARRSVGSGSAECRTPQQQQQQQQRTR